MVVGDLIGEGISLESAVVGDTPNLAARLQSIAGVDEVLVAAATRAVAGGRFDYQALGPQDIKGFADPVQAWRVLSSSAAQSRFEAMHGADVTPLVGPSFACSPSAGIRRVMAKDRLYFSRRKQESASHD